MGDRFRETGVHDGATAVPPRRRTTPAPGGPTTRELASRAGNAAFARMARAGGGIRTDGSVHPEVVAAIDAADGMGRALGGETSRWAVGAFGDPVKNVRLHTGGAADALARAVSARAFTVGRSVFFAAGEYRPHLPAGRRLLAHELAHVVQQDGAPAGGPLRATRPGDAHERAADEAAEAAVD